MQSLDPKPLSYKALAVTPREPAAHPGAPSLYSHYFLQACKEQPEASGTDGKEKKLLLSEVIAESNRGLRTEQDFNCCLLTCFLAQQTEKTSLGLKTWRNLHMAWSKPHQTFSESVSGVNKMQFTTHTQKRK